jgi:hypothetical protein
MNQTGVRSAGSCRQAAMKGEDVEGDATQRFWPMRRSIDDAADVHPTGDEDRPPASWMVQLLDDCEPCGDGELRVALTVEELGASGLGVVAHLDPDGARRLRAALADALKEIGEPPGR